MLTRVLCAAAAIAATLSFAALDGTARAAEPEVAAMGLAAHPVDEAEVNQGGTIAAPHYNTGAVAYVLLSGLQSGDEVRIDLNNINPSGSPASLMYNTRKAEKDGAMLLMAGREGVPAGGWPEGTYTASVKVTRGGQPVLTKESKPIPFD